MNTFHDKISKHSGHSWFLLFFCINAIYFPLKSHLCSLVQCYNNKNIKIIIKTLGHKLAVKVWTHIEICILNIKLIRNIL